MREIFATDKVYVIARGLLMVKTVNKCTLNSLVSDLFCDRQRMAKSSILVIKNISIHRNISIYQYIRCLHEIDIQNTAEYPHSLQMRH